MNSTKKNSYYSFLNYDTRRRAKYSSKTIDKIVELKQNGKSIREIAKLLDIPYGSIHYMLRGKGEVNLNTSRPSNQYINRSEAMYMYDLSNNQFDYYRGRYKDKAIIVGNVVWIKREVFESKFMQYKTQRDILEEFNVESNWISKHKRLSRMWTFISSFDTDKYVAISKYNKHIETIISYLKDLRSKDFKRYKIAIKCSGAYKDKYPTERVNKILSKEYSSLLYMEFHYVYRLDKIYNYAKERYESKGNS